MEHAHHTHLGTTRVGGDIWLSRHERLEQIAVIGASGSGKSTFAEYLVAQDMARGDGVLLIDPNGPLAEAALQFVPPERHNHVCYLNVPDLDSPVGMNVLDDVHPDKRADEFRLRLMTWLHRECAMRERYQELLGHLLHR